MRPNRDKESITAAAARSEWRAPTEFFERGEKNSAHTRGKQEARGGQEARGRQEARERMPQRGNRLTSGERALLTRLLRETTLTRRQIAQIVGFCTPRTVSNYARGKQEARERMPQRGNRLSAGERALLTLLLSETTLTQLQIAQFLGVCDQTTVSYYARGLERPREVRVSSFCVVRRRAPRTRSSQRGRPPAARAG